MNWSPGVWDDVSTVGLLVFGVIGHVVAYVRGWLIPGRHHREIVEERDRQLANNEKRADKDAETIRTLAATIAEKNAVEEVTKHLLASFREAAGGGR